MAGIGSAVFADPNGPEAQAYDAQQRQPRDVEGDPEPNATPEEQAAYEKFVNNAINLASSKTSPAVFETLSGAMPAEVADLFSKADPPLQNNPSDNLAAALVLLSVMLEESMQQSGFELPEGAKEQAGREVQAVLVQASEDAGLHAYDEKEMEASWYRTVDLWRQVSPSANQDELAAEFDQIVQADREGRLGEVMSPDALAHGAEMGTAEEEAR